MGLMDQIDLLDATLRAQLGASRLPATRPKPPGRHVVALITMRDDDVPSIAMKPNRVVCSCDAVIIRNTARALGSAYAKHVNNPLKERKERL